MATIIDHVFGHCYGVGVRERCADLLHTVKDNLEAFYVMKGFNKKHRQQLAPQQHPTLQPLSSFSGVTSPGYANQGLQGLQRTPTGLEHLNVDFDSLLGSLNGGGNPEDFDIFSTMGAGHDAGAIFVPVDNGQGEGGGSGGGGAFGTQSPNGGLQQWVSYELF